MVTGRLPPTDGQSLSEAMDRRDFLRASTGLGLGAVAGLGRVPTASAASGGEELWRFETGDQIRSSPTVVDGTVFVGCRDENLYAVEATTGHEAWSFEADWTMDGAPAVVDGTVYAIARGNSVRVIALDATTGEEQWRSGRVLASSLTVGEGTVFVDSYDALVALDAESGEPLWSFDMGDEIRTSPTILDGTVYVGCSDTILYAVDAATGEEVWRFETNDHVSSSPTVADGVVYVGSGDFSLYAVDAATGEEVWRFDTYPSWVRSTPTVADGTVYVGCHDDNLYAVDAATGEEVWRFGTGGEISQSAPTVAGGRVFVGSWDENVYAVDAATGDEVWEFETDEPVASSPTVVDGVVYVGGRDGYLYAIDAGVHGSSEGSRVLLGTLGHHDGLWVGDATTGGRVEAAPLTVENLRLVQTVENTRAVAGEPYDHPTLDGYPRYEATEYGPASAALLPDEDRSWITWTAPDADVVAGRHVAPVFDLRTPGTDPSDAGVTVTARVVSEDWPQFDQTIDLSADAVAGRAPNRRRHLEEEYLMDVPEQLPLLDVLAGDGDHVTGEYPTFPAAADLAVELEVDGPDLDEPVTERVSLDDDVTVTPTLSVGLVGLENAGDYAFEDDPDLVGFAEEVGRFLLDTFPTNGVAVAVLPTPHRSHEWVDSPVKAARRAERVLAERSDDARTFHLSVGGDRLDDYDVRSVDVTLGVMPDDWGYEGGGVMPAVGRRPVANAALTRLGRGATVAAHEAAHYFLSTFYGEASIPDDGSTHVAETVASTGYAVQNGNFDVLPGHGSMVGGNSPHWTDSTTYQALADGDFEPRYPVRGPEPVAEFDAKTTDLLADVDRWAATPSSSTVRGTSTDVDATSTDVDAPRTDIDALRSDVDELRRSLATGVDAVDHYWEVPDGLTTEQWRQVRDLAADVEALGEELQDGEAEFYEDDGTTATVLGRRLQDAGSELADRANARLEEGVGYVLAVTGSVGEDLDLEYETVPVVEPPESGEGEGRIDVLDADGARIERASLATEIELIGQDVDRERIEGIVIGTVPLPDEAAAVEVAAGDETSTRIDPTIDPIRETVQALPDRAFTDGDARSDALEALDQVEEHVTEGRRQAVADRFRTLFRDLDDAIRNGYAPESADEPTDDTLFARIGQQIQRFGGEVPDRSTSGLPLDWLLAGVGVGGAALGGYALKRFRDGRGHESPDA